MFLRAESLVVFLAWKHKNCVCFYMEIKEGGNWEYFFKKYKVTSRVTYQATSNISLYEMKHFLDTFQT
jgi:hypothetical protein